MPKEKITISKALEEVNKTILMIGLEATIRSLRNARGNVSEKETIKFTMLTVCNVMEIDLPQLYKKNDNKSETVRYAKAFIVFYLRNEFEIEWKEIMEALNHNDRTWLWELLKTVEEMKPNLPVNKKWIEIKGKINQEIQDFKIQKK